jgi:lipoprotein-anchoring transpeptidase ErfK/SrfK
MHLLRSLPAAAATLLVAAAPAAAQSPTPTPSPVVPTPTPVVTVTPTPTPAPAAAGKLRISVKAPHRNRGRKVALVHDQLVVKGVLRPAVARQRVVVELTQGSRTLRTRAVRTRADGRFRAVVGAKRDGRLTVRAVHERSRRIKTARAKAVRVQAFKPELRFGSRGALLRLFQKGLARMKYPTSRTGVYDAATGRAVMAYRKLNRLTRVETPNADIIRAVLAGKGGYKVKHPRAGHHVEADISRQILALVDGDRVVRIEPVSSGKPSTPTVMGVYHFYSKTPGTNSHGMVYSNYFIRGYAIHGYADVPAYNASHGCLRIPIPDAIRVYNWIRLGDTIYVEP